MRSACLRLCAIPILQCVPGGSKCSIEIAGNPRRLRKIPVLPCVPVLTKGMSVVGPRPALPNEVATYNDYQRQRLLVKPGMTRYCPLLPDSTALGRAGLIRPIREALFRQGASGSLPPSSSRPPFAP